MKLPPDVIFHDDIRLMVFRPGGVLNENRVNMIVEFLDKEEARGEKPFNRFTDTSGLVAIDLDFGFVFRVALHRRLVYTLHSYADDRRQPIKSAFYVTSPAAAEVVKTHALVTEHSPIQVAMFKDLAEAAKWLGVSQETLKIGAI
jgi:hypothetical protein